ncbi:MAG: hypothetical protein HC793_01255 [Aquincola sp.]|nr:hypothetical protein [Aquincola sp.]
MNAPMDLQARVQQYLTERRRLGFHLRSPGHALPNFARFVEVLDNPTGSDITVDLAVDAFFRFETFSNPTGLRLTL